MWNLCGCQVSHEKKQHGIHRNMQIEIDETVHEKTDASQETGELQSPGKRIVQPSHALHRLSEQDSDEPGAAYAAGNARFCKSFQIIVVGVVDYSPVIECFIGWKNDLNGAEPCSPKGVIQKDPPSVPSHGGTLSPSHFE